MHIILVNFSYNELFFGFWGTLGGILALNDGKSMFDIIVGG